MTVAEDVPEVPALRCTGLVHVYRVAGTDVAALRGVDLDARPAQRVALLGPSGSGKSTLLTVAAGVMRPSAGAIEVFGVDLATASERQLHAVRGSRLGLMLQGASTNLLLHEDPLGNVEWALRGRRGADPEIGRQVLRAGGLESETAPVRDLSPSSQQITALAAAMASAPDLLLVDEPTSQLDDRARDRLLDLLVEVADRQGTAVLLVTHDEEVAARMQRMIHLRDGRIGEEATEHGRFAVIGTDGSVQIPQAYRQHWPAGALVRIEPDGDELRIRRATP